MKNKDAQSYYDEMAKRIENPYETRNKAKDFSRYDIEFMKQYVNKNFVLLDLGSGTGLLINHLVEDFKKIIAVEKYPEFSRFINNHENLTIINEDIMDFNMTEAIDVASLFGVMSCFNCEEAKTVYYKVFNMLQDNGTLIVKNQMGVSQDVVIAGWSNELQTNYFAEYRYVDAEIKLLESIGFKRIEKIDIYPQEYNRWVNTHFYALVCKK